MREWLVMREFMDLQSCGGQYSTLVMPNSGLDSTPGILDGRTQACLICIPHDENNKTL